MIEQAFRSAFFLLLFIGLLNVVVHSESTNSPPIFTETFNNIVLSENTPIGTVVYRLEGYDPEGSNVTFGSIGAEHFEVDPESGNITLIKALDREQTESLNFLVTIRDRVTLNEESENDNIVQVPINFIVLDENDNAPEFQNTPYESDVNENSPIGTTIYKNIVVTDRDSIGETLDLKCTESQPSTEACGKFAVKILEHDTSKLTAAIILNDTLNYNQRMIYHFLLEATDGFHQAQSSFEVRVVDVQDKPPVFQGPLSTVIDEDVPLNTLVLTIRARDGDTGEPRKIVYDLLTNPMDFFLLNERTGELRTAKPLDREILPDNTSLITLKVRAREVVNGTAIDDPLTSSTALVTVTVRDINDSPPVFNQKEYNTCISENTPPGTPLSLDMSVSDSDAGINSKFALRLDDVSGVFEVEPKIVVGSSPVSIRINNKTLDYENPNQRKFIVLVIAEEIDTQPRLSSSATITICVYDINDNKPMFELESYSATVSELAQPGQYITTITARDVDSGSFGDNGIQYSLAGIGAELFNVNNRTGVITLADCSSDQKQHQRRQKRSNSDTVMEMADEETDIQMIEEISPESEDIVDERTIEISTEPTAEYMVVTEINTIEKNNITLNCLDYETENAYFLNYKAIDDNGRGLTSVVSLRISVIDENDSPPVCESPLYRASVDEGSHVFDSPLIVKARDVDTISEISYRISGSAQIKDIFTVDSHSGHVHILPNASLDVNHLGMDNLVFDVEASDGKFTVKCGVNVTVRDVNNHAPRFLTQIYSANVEESADIGTSVNRVEAVDLDSGINAELRYRIQQGSFDDFRIDKQTGEVFVSRKLDFDRRNTYEIEVLAIDAGTPSLSGTATMIVNVVNSNDKDPYFAPVTQYAAVRENISVGSIIHTLIALDPDVANRNALAFAGTDITVIDKSGKEIEQSGRVEFKDYFTITSDGKVVLNKPLDRNVFSIMRINVLVTDSTAPTVQQGRGLLVIQIIDINKNKPVFNIPWTESNPVVKLQMIEEEPIGTVLTILQGYDEDSNIGEYNITPNPYFVVNHTSGVITSIARIDYEQIKEVKFIATITDTGEPPLSATAEVTVDIINLNDNEPEFKSSAYIFNVSENAPAGTFVGTIEAFDADIGAFGEVTYSLLGDSKKYFAIDSQTGKITVLNSTALDHESVKELVITAEARDKSPAAVQKSSAALIHINIIDENDNEPVFTEDRYTSVVAENAALAPPAALLQVKALDRDDGIFGDVRYSIMAGNDLGLFRLDPVSGIIYPARNLSGMIGIYQLTVSARDIQGMGPLESITTVEITVKGVNLHRPTFINPALSNATIEIPGDIVSADYLILTVKAVDNDTNENGQISYHLQDRNRNVQETGNFKIHSMTGELRTQKELLRKKESSYNVILVAQDAGNPTPYSTLRFLSIKLVDANENQAKFPDTFSPYKIVVNENNEPNIKVGHVQASVESKRNKNVYYYMLMGNDDDDFDVDKDTGYIYAKNVLDREKRDFYKLYILSSVKSDLVITAEDRKSFTEETLDSDNTVAKVWITVGDENDNAPVFAKEVYFAGVSAKAQVNVFVLAINATDADERQNSKLEYMIVASNLYKFGTNKLIGSIVPSPFEILQDGRIMTTAYMAEYNQDRFELEIVAKEVEAPYHQTRTRVLVWIYDHSQLVRVIFSRPPEEVFKEREAIVAELHNATQHIIIVDEIRFHVDDMGRIRNDWCDLFFHAVEPNTLQIAAVDELLKMIDVSYDLRDYYSGFGIKNVVPGYRTMIPEEFDLAVAGLVALIIVLFVGAISFIVLCCCLRHWNLSVPVDSRRKDALIKKQIIDDLNTTENPLWIEQKLKLYEEQELTMQVFSEPDHISQLDSPVGAQIGPQSSLERINQCVDNTYATIQPRNGGGGGLIAGSMNNTQNCDSSRRMIDPYMNDFSDYATLHTNRTPSMYEFTGSTFQAPVLESDDTTAELI